MSWSEATHNLSDFPLVSECIERISGGRARCKVLLAALEKKTPKQHYGASWDYLFSSDKDIAELDIGYTEGDTEFLVDDDKFEIDRQEQLTLD